VLLSARPLEELRRTEPWAPGEELLQPFGYSFLRLPVRLARLLAAVGEGRP
jgi:hypothetical protein